jgi:hypothetical protein
MSSKVVALLCFAALFSGVASADTVFVGSLAGLYKLSAPDRAAADVSIPIHPAID